MLIKQKFLTKFIGWSLIAIAAVGIYFYYGGVADSEFLQILGLGTLAALNFIYFIVKSREKNQNIAKGFVFCFVIGIATYFALSRQVDVRLILLWALGGLLILNFVYLIFRRFVSP